MRVATSSFGRRKNINCLVVWPETCEVFGLSPELPCRGKCPACGDQGWEVVADPFLGGCWSHCGACGWAGDIIESAAELWNTEIPRAVTRLRLAATDDNVHSYMRFLLPARIRAREFWKKWSAIRPADWAAGREAYQACLIRPQPGVLVAPRDILAKALAGGSVYDPTEIEAGSRLRAARRPDWRRKAGGAVVAIPHWDLPKRLSAFTCLLDWEVGKPRAQTVRIRYHGWSGLALADIAGPRPWLVLPDPVDAITLTARHETESGSYGPIVAAHTVIPQAGGGLIVWRPEDGDYRSVAGVRNWVQGVLSRPVAIGPPAEVKKKEPTKKVKHSRPERIGWDGDLQGIRFRDGLLTIGGEFQPAPVRIDSLMPRHRSSLSFGGATASGRDYELMCTSEGSYVLSVLAAVLWNMTAPIHGRTTVGIITGRGGVQAAAAAGCPRRSPPSWKNVLGDESVDNWPTLWVSGRRDANVMTPGWLALPGYRNCVLRAGRRELWTARLVSDWVYVDCKTASEEITEAAGRVFRSGLLELAKLNWSIPQSRSTMAGIVQLLAGGRPATRSVQQIDFLTGMPGFKHSFMSLMRMFVGALWVSTEPVPAMKPRHPVKFDYPRRLALVPIKAFERALRGDCLLPVPDLGRLGRRLQESGIIEGEEQGEGGNVWCVPLLWWERMSGVTVELPDGGSIGRSGKGRPATNIDTAPLETQYADERDQPGDDDDYHGQAGQAGQAQ